MDWYCYPNLKKLIVVRHGEAEHILTGTVGGWTDTKLTPVGKEQAVRTGQRLAKLLDGTQFNFYCSDLKRAHDTARIVGSVLQSEPVVAPELRELNNGIAANKTKEEAEALRLPQTDPILDWVRFPDGESWMMMYNRVASFMERIDTDAHPTTLLVTHANTAVATIQLWFRLPRNVMAKTFFDIEPWSVTVLTINSWHEQTITKLNDTCHLATSGEPI